MARHKYKRLVIDASVARSCGAPDAESAVASDCRDFLIAVLQICHRVVMTDSISQEWAKHQSNFARRWRVQMVARKKMYVIDEAEDEDLRDSILQVADGKKERRVLEKDIHLVQAALASDGIVISRDESAWKAVLSVRPRVTRLQRIIWLNPTVNRQDVLDWLKQGAGVNAGVKLTYGTAG